MYRFRVGDCECTVLNDGNIVLPPADLLPPERRAEWPPMALDAQGGWILPINCLLVRSPRWTLLVDTGNGSKRAGRRPGGGELPRALAEAGVAPEEVDIVAVTHLHRDHTGGATRWEGESWVPAFPKARFVVPKADWEYWMAPERGAAAFFLREDLQPMKELGKLELAAGEAEVAEGIHLLPAPGHTPGHCVVLVCSRGEAVLSVGDLVHTYVQLERPDMVRVLDVDQTLVEGSRRRVIDRALELSALILSSHESYPGIGRLSRQGQDIVYRSVS